MDKVRLADVLAVEDVKEALYTKQSLLARLYGLRLADADRVYSNASSGHCLGLAFEPALLFHLYLWHIFGLRLSLSPPTVRLPRCCCVRRLDIPIQVAKNLLLPRAPCPRSCRSQGCRIKSVQTRILNPPKTQLLAVWISRGSSDASPLFLGSTRVDLGFASWRFDGKKKSWQTCDAGMFIRSSEKLSNDNFGFLVLLRSCAWLR